MHALQLLPLLLIGCELLSRRNRALRVPTIRFRLVGVATAGYAGLLALVTWQALRGQSILHPDPLTVALFAVIVVGVLAGAAVVLRAGRISGAPASAVAPLPLT